jgi:putative ABC transport system permease protein
MSFRTDSTPEESRNPAILTVFLAVTPQYLDTLGIELRSGRFIATTDRDDSQPVVVLSAAMAQHYFGDEDPIGRQIAHSFGGDFSDWYTVVGVVGDALMTSVTADAHHAYYLAQYQNFPGATVLVRTDGRAAGVTAGIVETIRALDPDRPIEKISTLAELRDDMIGPQRLNAILFGGFAGLALAIALVGIAGVLAFSVSQRRREMGIRVALGADRRGVVDLILREGALLTIGGVVAGLFGAIFLARSLAGLLFGVEASDPGTFVAVAFVLIAAGLVGAWIPARRAASVDPIEALRSD